MQDPPEASVEAVVDELRTAATASREARAAVDDLGQESAQTVADAHADAIDLLDRYESEATGTGDFGSYVEFRANFEALVDGLPEDLPERDAFEDALERVDKQVLSGDDFQRAREALAPVAETAALVADLADARERLREARRAARDLRADWADRVADLERVRDLGAADLDAPIAAIRDPVRDYNDAACEAFESVLADAPAREVLDLLQTTRWYPLVPFRSPPEDLVAYLADAPVGTEPIATVLEYADYSRSKLDHFVEDPDAHRRAVGGNRTYLERLDADPLTVEWPVPPAEHLRWRSRELVAVLGRFAPPEVVSAARDLRSLAGHERYDAVREAAVARDRLTEAELAMVREGRVEDELQEARSQRDRLDEALDEYAVD